MVVLDAEYSSSQGFTSRQERTFKEDAHFQLSQGTKQWEKLWEVWRLAKESTRLRQLIETLKVESLFSQCLAQGWPFFRKDEAKSFITAAGTFIGQDEELDLAFAEAEDQRQKARRYEELLRETDDKQKEITHLKEELRLSHQSLVRF